VFGPESELFAVLLATAVVAGLISLVASRFASALTWLENTLTYLSTGVILFMMVYIVAEVVLRYGFNSPQPGHLEGSELLLPIIVFFAVSYTQARNGHIGMTLVIDSLPVTWRRALEMLTFVLSLLVCAVLAYFGAKYAFQLYEYDDVTMTPPYWRTWPSAAAISLGYLMLAMRMVLQFLRLMNPERYPAPPQEDLMELHGGAE
jgi:TRAP-type C4-dicarboxylate transport system permease small subunit